MADHIPRMDWGAPNLAEAFRMFRQRLSLYFLAKHTPKEDEVPIILLAAGEEGLQRYNCWTLSESEQTAKIILDRFEEQLEPQDNFRVCRLKLSRTMQRPDEKLDDFINRCRQIARKCEFDHKELDERILEQIIASTPITDFRKDLLTTKKDFTLQGALQLGRTYEASKSHVQTLQSLYHPTQSIDAVQQQKQPKSLCKNCGRQHRFGKEYCPAAGVTCFSCNKQGHYAQLCLSTKLKPSQKYHKSYASSRKKRGVGERQHPSRRSKQVDNVREEHTESESELGTLPQRFDRFHFDTIGIDSVKRNEAIAHLDIKLKDKPGVHDLKVKVDTGAEANTLPLRTFRNMYPEQLDRQGFPRNLPDAGTILSAYNETLIGQYGTVVIPCKYGDTAWTDTLFYVVQSNGPVILGLQSSVEFGLVTLHCSLNIETQVSGVQALVQLFPQQFDRIGEFRTTHHLTVDPNVPSHVDAPRKMPIALKDKVKAELDSMESQGVIKQIIEPTEWVNSITYVTKKDGSIRICLDPRRLNKALIRPHYKQQTLEELNHKFHNMQHFSKLDAKCGYWSVKLDEASQRITTFQTPFGRYVFCRLPFGLSVSQDIFQLEMDRVLEGCKGAECIADDIVVFGRTVEEHDRNLLNFMQVAAKRGLTLNSNKCHIRQTSINFFGNRYSKDGIQPDPQKVADLAGMPIPSTKAELQHFLGFITYLSHFIPDFSTKTAVLRDLLKKEADFIWEPHHQAAMEKLKREVSEKSLLQFFDTTSPVYLQCDASLQGLGVALLQHDQEGRLRPVAYASKALSSTETRYSCIERELLAIVFGVERFHTYLYGRLFHVITDHKPLLMIMDKPLTAAPPRLQRMLIRLQGYNFQITHRPGLDNLLADSLSRLPSTHNNETVELDLRVDLVQFSSRKVDELKHTTRQDKVLSALMEVIVTGWPDTVKQVQPELRKFWSYRDELTVSDGIILKGNRVVIPKQMQPDILEKLHTSHLGQQKTKLLARGKVFWSNMNKDIDRVVQSCVRCQEHQPAQTPEPLQPHDIPTMPWSTVATDMFELKGKQWLIVVDYYSKYPVVRQLPDQATSSAVITMMQQVFAEHGIPAKVVSDNGPQYASYQFKSFAESWGFEHATSSPRRPQGNGFVERQIRTIKGIMKKTSDIQLALLLWRTTPISEKLPSPAEVLMNRQLRTTLPAKLQRTQPDADDIYNQLQERQNSQKFYFDKHARRADLPELYLGQDVRYRNPVSRRWCPATVDTRAEGQRSYILQSPEGSYLRRNRQHIRPDHTDQSTTEVPRGDDSNGPGDEGASSTDHDEQLSTPHRAFPETRSSPGREEAPPRSPGREETPPRRQRSSRNTQRPKKYDDFEM
ncbi:uncharacterized protein K02A2.6-like [Strongylocentrotus purpuratus]|uniref:Endonuclease n=1 Tax=Strongylocentrotus purpuratus TaxID=7668 RepID=A0A7M7PMV1_STRPU|nr:uncharacterized protein K02A2.6-like [Strongylocentrotus purpuratus]